jgi:nitrile hydratase subunit beta
MLKVYANAGLGYISPTMTTPPAPPSPSPSPSSPSAVTPGRCGYHDIGGLTAGEIDPAEEPIEFWHKQNEAMRGLLGDPLRRMVTVDEMRRAFESFGEEKYNALSFYERRLEAMLDILTEKGLIDREMFMQRVDAALKQRAAGAQAE